MPSNILIPVHPFCEMMCILFNKAEVSREYTEKKKKNTKAAEKRQEFSQKEVNRSFRVCLFGVN